MMKPNKEIKRHNYCHIKVLAKQTLKNQLTQNNSLNQRHTYGN
jgi:hypothetical protein